MYGQLTKTCNYITTIIYYDGDAQWHSKAVDITKNMKRYRKGAYTEYLKLFSFADSKLSYKSSDFLKIELADGNMKYRMFQRRFHANTVSMLITKQ